MAKGGALQAESPLKQEDRREAAPDEGPIFVLCIKKLLAAAGK